MHSIRLRLAVYYSLALTLTMAAFAAAVWWESNLTAPHQAETRLDAHLAVQSALATQLLQQQARVENGSLVVTGSDGIRALIPAARAYLQSVPDLLFVADNQGRVVYLSPPAQGISNSMAAVVDSLMVRRPLREAVGTLGDAPDGTPLRYHLTPLSDVPDLAAVLIAARRDVDLRGLQQIVVSMLFMAPLILVVSAALGFWLAGRALQPVEVLIDELAAIQDGTSLHRRLAIPSGDDEMRRLATTLNDMLGRVERSFVALRRFTADASHELKTPLMVLRAGVERSLTHPQTPGDLVPALDETLRQINQMSELVTNLLTLARADEGRSDLALVETDLRSLVGEAAETAEILGAERGVAVAMMVPSEPVMLPIDAGRMRQLLLNLVTNAVKYTASAGSVGIRLIDSAQSVTVVVQDSGIGIAPGDLPNVFERFWRADLARSRTGEHPGTGLGLAISKWIAEAHGGTIAVQSRAGRGSTFTVVLPKRGPPAPAELAGALDRS